MTQADSARRRQKDFGLASKHTYSEVDTRCVWRSTAEVRGNVQPGGACVRRVGEIS